MKIPIAIIMACALSIGSVYAEDTVLDFQAVQGRVNSLQTVTPGLPSGVSEPKGRIGFILSKIFGGDGKIGNRFLKAIGTMSPSTIPKWNGSSFISSQIIDNGTGIGIGASPVAGARLNINGNIAISGTPSSPTHAVTKSYVDSAVTGAGGLWSENGNNVYYNGGNVGIGTNDPKSRLHVSGNLGVTGWIGAGCESNCDTGGGYALMYGDGHTVIQPSFAGYALNARTSSASHGGVLGYNHDASVYGILGFQNDYAFYGSGKGYFSGTVSAANPTAASHLTTKFYVDTAVTGAGGLWSKTGNKIYYNTDNVGIGMTNPATKLDVAGDIRGNNVSTGCVGNCPASAAPPPSGNYSVSGDLNVIGDVTARNFYDQTPILSTTTRTSVYNQSSTTTSGSYRNLGTRITITVPAGPSRKYLITARNMARRSTSSSTAEYSLWRICKTATSTCIPRSTTYDRHIDGGRSTSSMTSYVILSPGTHTYYMYIYRHGSFQSIYHYSSSHTNIMAIPLQ